MFRKTIKKNNNLLVKSNELSNKKPKRITIGVVEDEHNITKTSSKKRLANKLVNQHITSYVLDVITVKSTNHNELEKLCLTDSKLSEIEYSFKIKENDYRSLITLLFGTDKLINDILDALAFNHPIFTQEYILSINYEKISSKDPNKSTNSSSNLKSKPNECTVSMEYDKSPSKVSNSSKTLLLLQNQN